MRMAVLEVDGQERRQVEEASGRRPRADSQEAVFWKDSDAVAEAPILWPPDVKS